MLLSLLAAAAIASSAGDGWILVSEKSETLMMSGDTGDVDAARGCLREAPGGCLWIRRGGKRYVLTDPSALKEIADAAGPQRELGREQAALGKEQEQVSKEVDRLAARLIDAAIASGKARELRE